MKATPVFTPGKRSEAAAIAQGRTVDWFYVGSALVLVVIVAVGFAPSFYFRYARDVVGTPTRPLPMYLTLHGIVLSSWYLLYLTQTCLIATKRVDIHRVAGLAGAVIAILLVGVSLNVVLRAPARNLAAGASIAQISLMVIGDIAILLLFAALVTFGFLLRRRKEFHKRLMTLASVSIVAPAIARWPGAEAALPLSVVAPQLSFCAALIVHDMVTMRRVHPATTWGVAAYLLVAASSVPLAVSDLGHRLVNALV
jgi:hypothetical protein